MKSICFVVATPFTANAFLLEHIKKLSEYFKVTLCLNLQLYPLSPDFDLKKIQVIDIPIERKIHPFKDVEALHILLSLFRSERFDAVHTVSPKAGLLGILAAYLAHINNRFHTFTGQVWVNTRGIRRSFYKLIDRLICKMATGVFADSQSQIDFLISQGICKKNEISMLGSGSISGVNLSRFRPNLEIRTQYRKLFGVSDGDIVFLFVGRLCKDKGIYDLLLAFENNYSQLKGGEYLWLVGPDEEGVEEQVKATYPELENQIQWIGSSFEPEKYMAAADILVLPSFREGFGSVVIEAAA
ncbi:glycosyltransferase family 4 protein [Polynucleobacter paneuropaeus]|uniref:Glycosyltransferase family 4 protein n=1 Tax=Polynucleobacter paneuropaeus TaxID=2527775 RepID=A0A9Q2WKK2_9BURK|nr:glycosyltransferase family 4 protein [Polynucleobacter paneuropaeus]